MRVVGSDSPRGPLLGPFFFKNCDFWPHSLISRCLMGGRRVQLDLNSLFIWLPLMFACSCFPGDR